MMKSPKKLKKIDVTVRLWQIGLSCYVVYAVLSEHLPNKSFDYTPKSETKNVFIRMLPYNFGNFLYFFFSFSLKIIIMNFF